MKLVVRRCPACDFDRAEILHAQDFASPVELRAPESYDVVACLRCGLAFADIAIRQSDADEVYRDHSKYAVNIYSEEAVPEEAPPPDAPFDIERLRDTARYLSERLPDRRARVLDAGCATGSFLGFLAKLGYEQLLGLDPSPTAVATATRAHGVRAIAASFLSPPKELGQFELVTLTHVLEHLTDVRGAIAALHTLLALGGVAYLEVPDATRYPEFLISPFHDFNHEHINHFSLPILRRLMSEYGFEEIDSGSKIVHIAPTAEYPAAYGLWRKVEHSIPRGLTWVRDEVLVAAMRRYVEASAALLARIDEGLSNDLARDESVVVWGVGNLTMKLLEDTVLSDKHVAAFIDSSPQRQGMHFGSTVIVDPGTLRSSDPAIPIVVASLHHDESIVRTIREGLQLPHRIVTLRHNGAMA